MAYVCDVITMRFLANEIDSHVREGNKTRSFEPPRTEELSSFLCSVIYIEVSPTNCQRFMSARDTIVYQRFVANLAQVKEAS